jgi:hypothetical protein
MFFLGKILEKWVIFLDEKSKEFAIIANPSFPFCFFLAT